MSLNQVWNVGTHVSSGQSVFVDRNGAVVPSVLAQRAATELFDPTLEPVDGTYPPDLTDTEEAAAALRKATESAQDWMKQHTIGQPIRDSFPLVSTDQTIYTYPRTTWNPGPITSATVDTVKYAVADQGTYRATEVIVSADTRARFSKWLNQ